MSKGKNKIVKHDSSETTDEVILFEHVSRIIETRKHRAQTAANSEVTLMYWEIGKYINSVVLDDERAAYGKQIVATLSPQLSWSHIIELLPLKSDEARLFYAQDVMNRQYGVRELRHQISRKAYERREIANSTLTENSSIPFNTFKDPFLLDVLDLKDNYLEADLEKAILKDVQSFILEFGHGFAFIESQKRMSVGDDEYILDLLFFNRNLNRLVAVELKLGSFKPCQHRTDGTLSSMA